MAPELQEPLRHHYEGGGFFRQRLLLATLTGTPIRISRMHISTSYNYDALYSSSSSSSSARTISVGASSSSSFSSSFISGQAQQFPIRGVQPYEASLLRLLCSITEGSRVHINSAGTTLTYYPGQLIGCDTDKLLGAPLVHQCHSSKPISYYLEPLLLLAPFCKYPLHIKLIGITDLGRVSSPPIITTTTCYHSTSNCRHSCNSISSSGIKKTRDNRSNEKSGGDHTSDTTCNDEESSCGFYGKHNGSKKKSSSTNNSSLNSITSSCCSKTSNSTSSNNKPSSSDSNSNNSNISKSICTTTTSSSNTSSGSSSSSNNRSYDGEKVCLSDSTDEDEENVSRSPISSSNNNNNYYNNKYCNYNSSENYLCIDPPIDYIRSVTIPTLQRLLRLATSINKCTRGSVSEEVTVDSSHSHNSNSSSRRHNSSSGRTRKQQENEVKYPTKSDLPDPFYMLKVVRRCCCSTGSSTTSSSSGHRSNSPNSSSSSGSSSSSTSPSFSSQRVLGNSGGGGVVVAAPTQKKTFVRGEVLLKTHGILKEPLQPFVWVDVGRVKRIRGTAFAAGGINPLFAKKCISKARYIFNMLLPDVWIYLETPPKNNKNGNTYITGSSNNSGSSGRGYRSDTTSSSSTHNSKNKLRDDHDNQEGPSDLLKVVVAPTRKPHPQQEGETNMLEEGRGVGLALVAETIKGNYKGAAGLWCMGDGNIVTKSSACCGPNSGNFVLAAGAATTTAAAADAWKATGNCKIEMLLKSSHHQNKEDAFAFVGKAKEPDQEGEQEEQQQEEKRSEAERLAEVVAQRLLLEVQQGGVVDTTHQCLPLLFAALADEHAVSRIRLSRLTPYAVQFIRHIRDFLGVVFHVEETTPKHTALNLDTFPQDDHQEEARFSACSTPGVTLKCVGVGLKNMARATF